MGPALKKIAPNGANSLRFTPIEKETHKMAVAFLEKVPILLKINRLYDLAVSLQGRQC